MWYVWQAPAHAYCVFINLSSFYGQSRRSPRYIRQDQAQAYADRASRQRHFSVAVCFAHAGPVLADSYFCGGGTDHTGRSEEHTSELQSLMRISYAVFCLKKKNTNDKSHTLNI